MRKVRLAAAALAVLTALIDLLFCLNPDSGASVLLPTAAGAICLAAVVPFDAREPPARKRVFAGCLGFVAALAAAAWFALQSAIGGASLGMLALLLAAGLILAGWSFAVRNRRRRPSWAGYYDL